MAELVRPIKFVARDEVTKVANRVASGLSRTEKAAMQANRSMVRATGGMRMMRGGMNQLGYQVQDIAVQLQMGTNPFTVLAQQGSQVASIFGAGGALFGAVLAIGGALAMNLMPKLFKTGDAMKDLREQAGKLNEVLKMSEEGTFDFASNTEKMMRVLGLSGKFVRDSVNAALIEMASASDTALGGLTGFTKGALKQLAAMDRLGGSVKTYNDIVQFGAKGTTHITRVREWEKVGEAVDGVTERLGLSEEEALQMGRLYTDVVMRPSIQATQALGQFIENLAMPLGVAGEAMAKLKKEGLETLTALATAQQAQMATTAGNVGSSDKWDEAVKAAKVRRDLIKAQMALDARYLAEEEKAAKAVAKAEEEKRQAKAMTLSMAQQTSAALMNALGEESAAGKAAFLANQALAIANAIISTNEAAAKALAQGGPAYQAVVYGLGAANIGMIAGQTVASFEGGGMTPASARAGGMDGRGGRTAVIHPNEQILDMEQGGGMSQPVSVSFNITATDAASFDEMLMERRSMFVRMVRDSMQARGQSLGGRA